MTKEFSQEPGFEHGSWKFDDRVTDQFDEMLSRSIPQYPVMREACFDIGSRFVQPHTEIADLGASRGEAIAPFVERFGNRNSYTLVETSKPMVESMRNRFQHLLPENNPLVSNYRFFKISEVDLREEFPLYFHTNASLTLCVLTLQFIPIEHRFRIVQKIFDTTAVGGALIVVEKILGRSAQIDEIFVETYLKRKKINGYSDEEIRRKQLALEGVLVPQTARANEEMLFDAGFGRVECFWRWMNFAGWVAVKI